VQEQDRVQHQQLLHGDPLHAGPQALGQAQTLGAAPVRSRYFHGLSVRRKIRLIEGNANCRHLKYVFCKGTWQVFICPGPRTPYFYTE
jgi:hypothetical protein